MKREQLYIYKGNRCGACGLSVQEMIARYGTVERMFEFHHINPKTKDPDYKRLMKRVLSASQLDEIDKCTLLCKQCHGIIHAQDMTGQMTITVEFDGRSVSQNFSGWFVADGIDKTLTFVTNERFLLQRYTVKVGNEDIKELCPLEIEMNHLVSWIRNFSEHKLIEISRNGHLMMRMKEFSNGRIEVHQEIEFPITAINMESQKGEEILWFRNGIMLTAKGDVHTHGSFNYLMTPNLS